MSAFADPDRFLKDTYESARTGVDRCVGEAADYAQREPAKALLSALAAGYVLRMLPVGGLVRMLISLLSLLVKPAVLCYGGAKLWKEFQGSSSPASRRTAPNGAQ